MNYVSKYADSGVLDGIDSEMDRQLSTFDAYRISLPDEQKVGLRSLAEGREGIVNTVCRIAGNFTECLPRNEDPAEMKKALEYWGHLTAVIQKVDKLKEALDDTQAGLGADLMGMTDRFTNHLQTARKSNNNLDLAMRQVDEFNQKFVNEGLKKADDNGQANA